MINLSLRRLFRRFVFQKLAKPYGGLLGKRYFGGYSKVVLDSGNKILHPVGNEESRLDVVYNSTSIEFVHNGLFNAFACGKGKYNFIGIYAGLPSILADYCMIVMRCNEVWSILGEEPNSKETPDHLANVLLAVEIGIDRVLEKNEFKDSLYKSPSNSLRFRIANDMFFVAIYFLIYHELCHIARGHIDLLNNKGNFSVVMCESVMSLKTSDEYLKRQWLELDADRRAMFLLLEHLAWDGCWDATDVVDVLEENSDHSPAINLRLIFFSIGTIFVLFDYKKEPIEPDEQRSHPHPSIRLAHAFQFTVSYLVEHYSAPTEVCKKAMVQALKDLDILGVLIGRNLIGYISTDEVLLQTQLTYILSSFDENQMEPAWQSLFRRLHT